MKIDPPVEPAQHAEVTTEPPVTPIAGRTRPEETDATAGLSSWASPAFFQRSRASFGTVVDTRLDPFAEDDGFVPGKGRKRPRFSMRSSEWRLVDEPPSPGEKASSVDWAAELEDESLEQPEFDEKGPMENTNARREEPRIEEPLPEVEGLSGAAPVITLPTDQPIPEINFGIEQPVNPEATNAAEAVLPVSEKADANALHMPMDTPRLLPVPSPGLPVPSPLVSTPDSQQGYFASAAAATQTQAPSTMTGLSQSTTIEDNVVSDIQPEPWQAGTAATPAPEVINGNMSTKVSEFVTESDVPQKPAPTLTAGAMESLPADNIKSEEERITGGDHGDYFSATLTGNSVEEEARIKDDASHSEDIKMEEIEDQDVQQSSSDEQGEDDLAENEDNEEDSQQDEESDEDEQEEIKSEQGEGERDGQAIGFQNAEKITEAKGTEEDPDEAADDESDSAQSRTESHSEPEEGHGHYIEDQDEMYNEEEDEEEPESEQGYENEQEEAVDSEIASDEESDEQPYQAQPQAPSKGAQAEVIVLDSDDEDEQPAPNSQTQIPIQPKQEQPEESADDQELYEDWSSGEEKEAEDEVMADGQSNEEHDDYGDEYEKEEQTGERVEDEQAEDEQVEDGVASDEQEQGSLADEQEEDEEEDADTTIPEEHGTTTHIGTEEDLRTNIQDEAHVTEDVAWPFEHDIHERDAPTAQDLSGPAIDVSTPQFDVSAEDAVLDEKRERFYQPSEVLEHPPTTELYQGADPALIYDGQASPRVAHEPLLLPPDSLLDQQAVVTPDRAQEAEPSHQISANHVVDEAPVTPPKDSDVALQAQIELSVKSDDAPVDMFGTPEEEPRSRSLSIIHQEQLEINEHAGEQNSHIPAKLGEDELIQLQDGLRRRDGVSEESETYAEQDAIPDRQYPGLRSKLSYFAPLSTLVDHFHTLVDTISIVHNTSSIYQTATGKKDYTLELLLTDPSLAGNTLTARLYRPYKEAIPSLSEGDAILLRNFTVKSSNHSMTLVSVNTSAWAVFSDNNNEAAISGPPVEYGTEELSHATDLRQWYQEDGAAMVADKQLQASLQIATGSREITPIDSVATSDSGGFDSIGRDGRRDFSRSLRRSRKSHRRITIHELRDGRRYAEVGSPSDRESIHELRDGTVYANL